MDLVADVDQVFVGLELEVSTRDHIVVDEGWLRQHGEDEPDWDETDALHLQLSVVTCVSDAEHQPDKNKQANPIEDVKPDLVGDFQVPEGFVV